MIDNLRPLRLNIIQSIRAMPSYYEGRQKKDALKPKQFQMNLGEDSTLKLASGDQENDEKASANDSQPATFGTNMDLSENLGAL